MWTTVTRPFVFLVRESSLPFILPRAPASKPVASSVRRVLGSVDDGRGRSCENYIGRLDSLSPAGNLLRNTRHQQSAAP